MFYKLNFRNKIYFPSYLLYRNVLFITFLYEHLSNTLSIWICFIHNIFHLEICYPTHFLYESGLSYTFSMWESVIQYIVFNEFVLFKTFPTCKCTVNNIFIRNSIIQYILHMKMCYPWHMRMCYPTIWNIKCILQQIFCMEMC